MAASFCDELEFGFGWLEPGRVERCSHALRADGRVWIVDPLDAGGVDARIRDLGEPAGVVQLLDRHDRDCAAFAARFGVPLHRVPANLPAAPFDVVGVVGLPGWREIALWWPAERVLVCADALGTASYFRAPGERLAVHPLLRLTPPRRLRGLEPEHVLVGHGTGVHGADATVALTEALATSRGRFPRWLAGLRKEK